MPRRYIEPTGPRKVEFWIRSSRGTDASKIVNVPEEWDDSDLASELEDWCEGFPAWSHPENYIRYGWNDEKDFGNRK